MSSPQATVLEVQRRSLILWIMFLGSILAIGLVFPMIVVVPGIYFVYGPIVLVLVAVSFLVSRWTERQLRQMNLPVEDPTFLRRFQSIASVGLILRLTFLESAFILSMLALAEFGRPVRIILLVVFGGLLGAHFPTAKDLEQTLTRVAKGKS